MTVSGADEKLLRTLVLCDDYWHPASTARAGLAALASSGFAFDWIENTGEWPAQHIQQYSVVLLTKMNHVSSTDQTPWMTKEIQTALVEYVHNGSGLLVIHSGTAAYDDWPLLRGLMGGAFANHPAQCPVTVEPHKGHHLTGGRTPFTLLDEHYFMDLVDDEMDVFLTTTSEHGSQPGGWTRTVGAGRVCVLTPGHNLEVWLHPSYQAVIHNVLLWCGRASLNG